MGEPLDTVRLDAVPAATGGGTLAVLLDRRGALAALPRIDAAAAAASSPVSLLMPCLRPALRPWPTFQPSERRVEATYWELRRYAALLDCWPCLEAIVAIGDLDQVVPEVLRQRDYALVLIAGSSRSGTMRRALTRVVPLAQEFCPVEVLLA